MASRVQRIARSIDDVTRAVWDESGPFVKLLVMIVLIVTGAAIPLIPLALLARYIAR